MRRALVKTLRALGFTLVFAGFGVWVAYLIISGLMMLAGEATLHMFGLYGVGLGVVALGAILVATAWQVES